MLDYLKKVIFFFLVFQLPVGWSQGHASWLVDRARLHMSVHGQLSCLECHDDIESRKIHPDPKDVTRQRTYFFSKDHCLNCHDDIEDQLGEGRHGRKKVTNREKYTHCIRCHKPHYQLPVGENRVVFKPGIPKDKQCDLCHENKKALPPLPQEDRNCAICHVIPGLTGKAEKKEINNLCLHCHALGSGKASHLTAQKISLLDLEEYNSTGHSSIACTECHTRAAAFNHSNQKPVDCLRCHVRHDEKKGHDAHLIVSCSCCHFKEVTPVIDPTTRQIQGKVERKPGQNLNVHELVSYENLDSCKKCHFPKNPFGASAMVLPAKSIICMGCHASTYSAGDTVTFISLTVFVLGLILCIAYWFTGTVSGNGHGTGSLPRRALNTIFSKKLLLIVKTIVLDVFLQRRLFIQSRSRWFIHALIFYPFVFRFTWGITALLGSLWIPQSQLVWHMIDKNNPITGLCFDISGILILLGIASALIRETYARLWKKPGVPDQDWISLVLIGGIVIIGFLLEGMRMAMTQWPGEAEYALMGFAISKLFSGLSGLTSYYGYMWYAHAILTGALIAYLPFSRLFHVIMAPVALVINAVSKHDSNS